MDVVEVSPPYDHADITAMLGNRVVLKRSALARAKQDRATGVAMGPEAAVAGRPAWHRRSELMGAERPQLIEPIRIPTQADTPPDCQ